MLKCRRCQSETLHSETVMLRMRMRPSSRAHPFQSRFALMAVGVSILIMLMTVSWLVPRGHQRGSGKDKTAARPKVPRRDRGKRVMATQLKEQCRPPAPSQTLPPLHNLTSQLSPDEHGLWSKHVSTAKSYMEFGVGTSTHEAVVTLKVPQVYAVDTSPDSVRSVEASLHGMYEAGEQSVKLTHVNVGAVSEDGLPRGRTCSFLFPQYPRAVAQAPTPPDVVYVNGWFRLASALYSIKYAPGATLLWREDAWKGLTFSKLEPFVDVVDRAGSLVVLRAKANINQQELDDVIDKNVLTTGALPKQAPTAARPFVKKTRSSRRAFDGEVAQGDLGNDTHNATAHVHGAAGTHGVTARHTEAQVKVPKAFLRRHVRRAKRRALSVTGKIIDDPEDFTRAD